MPGFIVLKIAFIIKSMKKKIPDFEPLPGSEVTVKKTSRKKIRRVLGIDPGLANTGFGIVDFYEGRYQVGS